MKEAESYDGPSLIIAYRKQRFKDNQKNHWKIIQ